MGCQWSGNGPYFNPNEVEDDARAAAKAAARETTSDLEKRVKYLEKEVENLKNRLSKLERR